ncbi:MAG: NADH:ubiquinone reductase (Na(+)-transporting) subunit B [Flavobacteriales bacterium]|nr:NADH:ubiquinone reductase (Na(+)-transporting) subunit B [Flavobacteriales bacterium]MCB9447376.1 NADH:ubiquinone reductase (Na(+)-transporting) subunit B [Flavobacteriales bacterium]
MKFLRNLLDNIKPNFEKGGKFEKYYPVYDGIETFLFVPNHTTKIGSHIRDAIDLKRTMMTVIIALLPCMLFGMWNVGHQHYLAIGEMAGLGDGLMDKFLFGLIRVLPIIAVSYIVGLSIEFVFCIIKKHTINEGFLVSGLLIPMVMPVDVPLWMVGVGTAFAVIIGKEVFGGTGMNVLNPALTARAFLFFAYPTKMSGNMVWIDTNVASDSGKHIVDGFSGATPLGNLAELVSLDRTSARAAEIHQMIAPDGIHSLYNSFMGFIPGSIGETSALACLIGAVILIITGIGSLRIMASMFAGGLTMAMLFNAWDANMFMEVNAIHQLMLGGFMFGMVFMATDPVSAAQTPTGKIIYGFLAGFLAIMIRVFNPAYPEGVMLAILFMNVMAPLIDHYVVDANVKRRMKRLKTA